MAQTTQNQGRRSRGFSPAADSDLQAPQAALPEGGKIKGPGTGTSDSIPDEMRAGTFIMPADSTKALGAEALKRLANTPAIQGDFTQEQAHAAGIAFLTSLRDATHKPVADPDGDADTEGPGDVDDGSERNFADGGGVGDRPVMGGYRYSELPTADEIDSAVGAKEQAEQQKLAQLQGTQIKDPFSWQAQAKAADIKAGQKNLANLQSARAVGNKQLQFGPGAGKLAGDSQGNAGAFALAETLQESKGMRAGRPGDARSAGPAQSPLQLNSDGTVQHSSGKFAKGFSVPQQFARGGMVKPQDRVLLGKGGGGGNWMLEQNGYADGGAVGCGGKKPKARGFAGGGEVVEWDNIYPQGHPDAGAGIYDGLGTELGSSGKFAQVPQGVIGQQPPKPTAPPVAAARGFPAGSAPTKDAQPPGLSYADNNQTVGQGIKDSWSKGNYGEAVGKTVAGTVGMFTTPVIDGAVHGGGAAWDGAKGFGRGIFGMNDAASASATPPSKSAPSKATDQPAPKPSNSATAAQAESEAWGQQAQTTSNLKQRLAEKGRDGMTNAEVGQANPNGVVTMKRQANGVMEFSGNNIKGPVSYADEQGQAVAGAGIRGKGFGRVDVAPAGANVAMGPNGSYAFSNDPAPSRGQQAPQPYGGFGFPGAQQKPDTSSWMQPGMTAEQSLQYNQEVANARAINAQQQALRPARPEGTIMDGLMERTPDQQLRDAKTQASSIHGTTAALGKSELARLSEENRARMKAASERYASDNQLAGTSQTAGAHVRVADINERGATARAAGTNAIAQGELAIKQDDQGFKSRLAAQQEQLRNVLLDPNATPEQRRIAQRSLSALSGKTAADRMQVVKLPDSETSMGQKKDGGQTVIRTLEDGTVEQVPIGKQGGLEPIAQNQQATAIKNNPSLSLEQKRAALKKLGYD